MLEWKRKVEVFFDFLGGRGLNMFLCTEYLGS